MQPSRILLLAGAVTAGAISLAGLAYAGDSGLKTLGLQWPGGAVVQIVTTQPQARAVPGAALSEAAMPVAFPMPLPVPVAVTMPAADAPFAAPADPSAQLDRISAMMDRQADAMMRAMQVMMGSPLPGPNALMPAAFAHLPVGGGSASYAFVSISGGGGCMQSIEITSGGQGQAPHVVQQSAGSCGGHAMIGTPAVNHVAPPPAEAAPQLLRVRDLRPVAVPQASQT